MNSSKTIGIIGGGQLGQMMAISAIYQGHQVITLDPSADCPAGRVSQLIVAPYDDVAALTELAERCDVLTYEFENVDADGLDAVIKEGQLPQGQTCFGFLRIGFLRKSFWPIKPKSLSHLTRWLRVLPTWILLISAKIRFKNGDRWLRWAWTSGHCIRRRPRCR